MPQWPWYPASTTIFIIFSRSMPLLLPLKSHTRGLTLTPLASGISS